ncbi:MAG: hypothetical protein V1944_02270 [Candidatus Aenigmatarchaeota archaeon]
MYKVLFVYEEDLGLPDSVIRSIEDTGKEVTALPLTVLEKTIDNEHNIIGDNYFSAVVLSGMIPTKQNPEFPGYDHPINAGRILRLYDRIKKRYTTEPPKVLMHTDFLHVRTRTDAKVYTDETRLIEALTNPSS